VYSGIRTDGDEVVKISSVVYFLGFISFVVISITASIPVSFL